MKKVLLIAILYFALLLWRGAGGEVAARDQHIIDSLQQVLISPKNDTDKANIQNTIASELLLAHDLKGSLQYANQALTISKSKDYVKGMATALTNIGKVYNEQHHYLESVKQLSLAATHFKKINDKSGLADCCLTLGITYYYLDDNAKTLEILFDALKLQQETGNLLSTGMTYFFIGKTYGYQAWYSGDSSYYKTSMKYLNSAYQIFEKLNNNEKKAICLNAIAGFYLMAGNDDDAMRNASIAIKLLNGSNNREAIARSYIIIGSLYERKGLAFLKENNRSSSFKFLSDAKKNYLAAFEIVAHETLNKNHIAEVLVNLGSVNFNMQNYAESKLHLEEALELSKQYGFKDIIRDSYSLYVKLDSIQGDYRNALIHYKLYVLYKDSLSSEENTKKVTRTKLKYESEEREQQITLLTKESKLQQTELQKQNTTLNALIIACLLIALLAGIIYNRNRIKHNANAAIENTMQNLKATQEQLVEHEKLASLGKFTADVAREIEVPVKQINQLTKLNRTLILNIKNNSSIVDADALKNNLQHIYNYGKEADAVVKKVLTETRKVQS